jgi:hypothetical protein
VDLVDLAAWLVLGAEPEAASVHPIGHVAFVEVLGNGLLYSANYELYVRPWNMGFRAGTSFFTTKISDSVLSHNYTLVTVPLVANYYVGTVHHKLQLGLGATLLYTRLSTDALGNSYGTDNGLGAAATAIIGYRYFPADRGFSFGLGFTPLLRASKGVLPWGGVEVGWVF